MMFATPEKGLSNPAGSPLAVWCGRRAFSLCVLFWLVLSIRAALGFTAQDAGTVAGSFTSAFYVQNGTNGYFKDTQTGGVSYFWTQAEMIESVNDAYEWTGNPAYGAMITNLLNGFISNNGSSWTWNMYNDDILWAVLAFARGGQLTGHPEYCALARANFDACYSRAWDSALGGGLYWTTDKGSKNACVNGPGAIAACVLYQIYGDTAYWTKGSNIYQWERAVLFNAANGAIADAIGIDGSIGYWASTYNQGTFIGAANFLGQTNDARLAANFTMMNMSGGGLLPEYGIAGNNSGFNAIFLRWLTRFMRDRNLRDTYEPWLQLNADAAWNVRRADNLSWCQWHQPTPMGTNFYSWDCISSFAALLAADPTRTNAAQSMPRNPAGDWPLNSTAGTNAPDVSGNGNHGTINGAVWNPNGRLGGCLTFNGVNSSVRVNNPLVNDFTIAFWVRTTQLAGTGQWYNGAGLVDSDVPFNQNDFGTALVGGKFAFGVGNPDTTIISSTAINDGVWHLCVATRQQYNGALKVYVDGVLRASGTGTRDSLNSSPQLLYGAIASGGGSFNGSLDEVKFYARTLSSDEILALYLGAGTAPPAAPASVVATAGNSHVRLSWSEAPAANSYTIKRSLFDGGPYTSITNVSDANFTDTGVVNNRTYFYVVSAKNDAGEGPDSAQVSAAPSSVAVWLKAESLGGLTNGSPVSLWPDATGNNHNAVQTTALNTPSYVTNAVNGRPGVRFDANESEYLWLYRPVQDDFTLMVVFQSRQGLNTGTDFWSGAGLISGEQPNTVDDFGISLNALGQVLAGTGNPDRTVHSGAGFNDGRPHVVTFKRSRASGSLALYVDGGTPTVSSGGTQSLTAPNALVVGAQGVLNNFFNGAIAELQIHGTAISDSDRVNLERSLKCKYGIGGAATLPPPTGFAGTAGNRKISLSWNLTPGVESYQVWRSTDNGASYQPIATGLAASSYVDTTPASGQTNYYRIASANPCGAGPQSVALAVNLPLPNLTLTVTGSALQLAWPAWASDWKLYAATNLAPPVVWSAVSASVTSNQNSFNVLLPIDTGNQFFRLSSP
jgi:predicted alpha-1,6-mannanase (GH76 family)